MFRVSYLPGWLEVLHKLSSFISDCFLIKAGLERKSKLQFFFGKWGIIYITQVLDLVNEDEGLPAKSSHAQCLTLWQLSSNPRQERRYLMMVEWPCHPREKRRKENLMRSYSYQEKGGGLLAFALPSQLETKILAHSTRRHCRVLSVGHPTYLDNVCTAKGVARYGSIPNMSNKKVC